MTVVIEGHDFILENDVNWSNGNLFQATSEIISSNRQGKNFRAENTGIYDLMARIYVTVSPMANAL